MLGGDGLGGGGRYFFDDGLEVLAFFGGGAGFGAEGCEVGEDVVVAEDGGLSFENLVMVSWGAGSMR